WSWPLYHTNDFQRGVCVDPSHKRRLGRRPPAVTLPTMSVRPLAYTHIPRAKSLNSSSGQEVAWTANCPIMGSHQLIGGQRKVPMAHAWKIALLVALVLLFGMVVSLAWSAPQKAEDTKLPVFSAKDHKLIEEY